MKKLAITTLIVTVLPLAAYAGDAQNSYTGPSAVPSVTTITAAQKAADDTRFVLEGQVVRQLSKDTYQFRDASGEGVVEIDGKHLPTVKFDDKTRVRLSGKVDKDWYQATPEIDVKMVEILN
ncbi:YgiW/YdeI family stress tolerance OB fold protein [Craterilacuibacter sinensis]|uniref:NirD/YgiW/YdeI family stress tolerance protein n=1 Tax=Craterilacuibacter sinensis TaxID=2686017 RepID=A0A845BLT3_9NEIS|nr:NirD/YgiW/YdeI family stress tolerance protein [Craterilacuibacter sinensis]MXR37295.1 NirD/YgiW/YdeI family stress tolerance protein [Craterilacuibacter sinensis]